MCLILFNFDFVCVLLPFLILLNIIFTSFTQFISAHF